jgi:hypothetical protein
MTDFADDDSAWNSGNLSHGRACHLDASHHIPFVCLHTEYKKGSLNDRLACG